MSNSDFAATMYESDPMVAALNKVPGFDPLKLMDRKRIPGAEKDEKSLDFRYKKLWFRLAHRTGRIRLNRLSITEQLAIIEAQVYLELTDSNPVSSFTAACTREESGDKYIEDAQIRAMDQALTDAGFGLQFVPAPAGSMENTAPQTAAVYAVSEQAPGMAQKAVQAASGTVVKGQVPVTAPKAAPPFAQQGQQVGVQQKDVTAQATVPQRTDVQQAGVQHKTAAIQAALQQRTVVQQPAAQQKTAVVQTAAQQRAVVQQVGAQQRATAAPATAQQTGAPQRAVAERAASHQSVVQQQTAVSQQNPTLRQMAAQQRPAAAQTVVRQQTEQQATVQQQTAALQQRAVPQQAAVPNRPAQEVQAQPVQGEQKGIARPAQTGMQKAAVGLTVPASAPQNVSRQSVSAETLPAGQPPVAAGGQALLVTLDMTAATSVLSGKGTDTLPVAPEGNKAEYTQEELPVAPAVIAPGNSGAPVDLAGAASVVPVPAANAGVAADGGRPYTEETPVEEILQYMTLEDAKKVVVSAGACQGQTLAEVAQRRRPSLRFYLSEAYQGRDNILRAGARLVLDDLEKKAG